MYKRQLVYVPRICGICSVAQSYAAAQALAQAMALAPPENGRLAANLTLAAENLADHLSHFYLFFMPDFAREAYRGKAWFAQAQARFRAVQGSAAADVLMEVVDRLSTDDNGELLLQPLAGRCQSGAAKRTPRYRPALSSRLHVSLQSPSH